MELHHDALHGGRAHWFRLRGRQMDEHRRTINYLHTGHTRYFMCGLGIRTTQNLFCRSRVLLCLELGCLELIK